jgi:hypothetical protein
VGEIVDLPGSRSRWFADARGRSLRVTHHPEADLLVFSLWQADRCIGTFRLTAADAPELATLLLSADAQRPRDLLRVTANDS